MVLAVAREIRLGGFGNVAAGAVGFPVMVVLRSHPLSRTWPPRPECGICLAGARSEPMRSEACPDRGQVHTARPSRTSAAIGCESGCQVHSGHVAGRRTRHNSSTAHS